MHHMNHSDNYQLMHELGHQLEAEDHYCENEGESNCGSVYCCVHGDNKESALICTMNDGTYFNTASDETLFCFVCQGLIGDHLSEHHLKEGS